MFLDISNKHIVEHVRKLLSFVLVLVLVLVVRGVVLVRRGLVVWSWPRSCSWCASCSFVVVSSLASWRRCLVVVGALVVYAMPA